MSERVLVTGAEGFIGRTLVRRLEADHLEVLRSSRSSGQDLRDARAMDAFRGLGIGTVFHLAAASHGPSSWDDPALFYEVNTLGTQRVVEFCRREAARIIYISTYVYGQPRYLPIDEDHPVSPLNPYSHSKWLAEEICRHYALRFGVRATIVRPFNIYGPGQKKEFLVAGIVDQWLRTGRVIVNDLTPRRDFLYLSDFVEACIAAFRHTSSFDIFNVGSGSSRSVEEVIQELQAVAGRPIPIEITGRARRDEIADIVAQCRLVSLGLWTPKVTLREGLALTLRESVA